jgi:hypothetical protein
MTSSSSSSPVLVAVERYAAAAAAVPAARSAAVRTLAGWHLDPPTVQIAELVACELITNAVQASPPGDVIATRLTLTARHLLIEAWDGSDARPVPISPQADEEHGRGLALVEALSTRWGWFRARDRGKIVWAEMGIERTERPRLETTRDAPMTLPRRSPRDVPPPAVAITFTDEPTLLRRVVNGLRALDAWHRPSHGGVASSADEGPAGGAGPGRAR